jgi:hypothetical protein
MTSTPRAALKWCQAIRARLIEGANYATLPIEERLEFIVSVLRLLSQVPSFRISTRLGRRQNFEDWPGVLRWWLAKFTLRRQPRA